MYKTSLYCNYRPKTVSMTANVKEKDHDHIHIVSNFVHLKSSF